MLMKRTGELIKSEMEKAGMSLKDFSKAMGLSKSKATDLLNGKEPLTESQCSSLCIAFPSTKRGDWIAYDHSYQEQRKKLEEI
jgi:plasmid maintenance system antidote protein VapI